MASFNRVIIAGNLTRDPELRQAGSSSVCKMGVAISEKYRTKAGEEREVVCFVDVDAWARQAETCAEYLAKGSPVLIEGRLQQDTWTDKQGNERSKITIRADRVQFLGKPRKEEKRDPAEMSDDELDKFGPPAPASDDGDLPF